MHVIRVCLCISEHKEVFIQAQWLNFSERTYTTVHYMKNMIFLILKLNTS